VVRGVRLVATGLVDQPDEAARAAPERARPLTHRRVYAGDRWVDETPVFHGHDLGAGSTIPGPALIQSPFTTVVLAEGDAATMLPSGDLLVDVAPL
jgi:N-methylhydantoinase A/oxoprolinase/acetone carboxylase beta subunit